MPKQNLLIAISGGQDSICLLFILINLQNQWNWQITLISCNHMWQKDSFQIIRQVLKLSFLFSMKFFLLIASKKLFNEQKARNWRHFTWQRLLLFSESNWLITGHTASDRIETILIQLFRGSGTKGIHSLYWQKEMFNPLNKKKFESSFYKFSFSSASSFFLGNRETNHQNIIINNFVKKVESISFFKEQLKKNHFFFKKNRFLNNKYIFSLSRKNSDSLLKKHFNILYKYIYIFKYTQKNRLFPVFTFTGQKLLNKQQQVFRSNDIRKTAETYYLVSKKFAFKSCFTFYFF